MKLKSDIEKFFQELQAAAQSGSVTADKAAKMNQGLSAAWDKFVSSIQNLEDALGKSGLNTLFAGILNGLSSLLDKISNTNPYVLFTGALVALGTAALAAVAKMMALSLAIARLGAAATV